MLEPGKSPKLSGFDWGIVDVSFTQCLKDNPLYTPKINDPDYFIQKQLDIFTDELEAFAEDPNAPLAGNGVPVHIGIDTEYQRIPNSQTNSILSYQFCLYSIYGVLKGIVYPKCYDAKGRIDFNVFLGIIIQTAMRYDLIDAWPKVAYV